MSDDAKSNWGLFAVGTAGGIEIDLSHDSQERRWLCELRLSKTCVTFEVSGEIAMRRFSDFVALHLGHTRFEEEQIGTFGGFVVRIIKDDEFPDRFFIRMRGDDGVGFALTFVDDDSQSLLAALKSLVEELPPIT